MSNIFDSIQNLNVTPSAALDASDALVFVNTVDQQAYKATIAQLADVINSGTVVVTQRIEVDATDLYNSIDTPIEILATPPAGYHWTLLWATYYLPPQTSGSLNDATEFNVKVMYTDTPVGAYLPGWEAEEVRPFDENGFSVAVNNWDFNNIDVTIGAYRVARRDSRDYNSNEGDGDIAFIGSLGSPVVIAQTGGAWIKRLADTLSITDGGTGYDDTGEGDAIFVGPDGRRSKLHIDYTATGGVIDGVTLKNPTTFGDSGIWPDHLNEDFVVDSFGGGNDDATISPTALVAYTPAVFSEPAVITLSAQLTRFA